MSSGCMRNFGDWGNFRAYKEYTFSNTASGEKTIFTVTGDVLVRIIPVATTSLTSAAAASLSFGIVGDNAFFISDTLATLLTARRIWHNTLPDAEIENMSAVLDAVITDGNDIVIDLTAQIDTGVLRFYFTWLPMSNDGKVE